MKKLIVLLVLAIALPSWAAEITKYGFRAYSSANQVECGVWGSGPLMPTDYNAREIIQNPAYSPSKSRTLLLGTKGFANYSTTSVTNISFTCRVKDTSTPVAVKVFMNGIETHVLTLDSGTFTIGR